VKSKWEVGANIKVLEAFIDPSTVQLIGIFVAYLQPMREGLHIQNI